MSPSPGAGSPRQALEELAARGTAWPAWATASPAGLRPAAVLVLFGVLDTLPAQHASRAVPADLDLLLVGRSTELTHHPGQVAFPGGRIDPGDEGPVAAALREAEEETGLDPAGVAVLGTLAALPVPVSRHLVTPVLAWWDRPSPVAVVDHRESAAVFRAPVADLVSPEHRGTLTLTRGSVTHRTPAFDVAGHLVWGFTAAVLDHLLDELGWAEEWDAGRQMSLPGDAISRLAGPGWRAGTPG